MTRASYSSVTLHRRCPQAWNYRHVQRLVKDDPEDVAVARDFGTWWHALRAADSIERGAHLGSLRYAPPSLQTPDGVPDVLMDDPLAMTGEVLRAMEAWWQRVPADVAEQWVAYLGADPLDNIVRLDTNWRARWEQGQAAEAPLAVELRWERQLSGTDTVLVGYVDEVVQDRRRNLVLVRDHKTHRDLGAAPSAVDSMMDSQLQFYAWGAAPTIAEWGVGQVRAVGYDRVRAVAPKRPALTQAGALSKSVTDYDLRTYVEWAGAGQTYGTEGEHYKTGKRAGEPKWGTYEPEQQVLDRLASPAEQARWFARTITPVSASIVKAHLRAAVDTARDMDATRERIEKGDGSAGRNLGAACRWCEYVQLCRAQLVGGAEGDYQLEDYRLRLEPPR